MFLSYRRFDVFMEDTNIAINSLQSAEMLSNILSSIYPVSFNR